MRWKESYNSIIEFFIMVSVSIACSGIMINLNALDTSKSENSNELMYEYQKELELKYWGSLSELTDEVQSYIDKCSPTSNLRAHELVLKCMEYDVDVKFALAQGKLESNFGTAGLASKTNSVWNLGAFSEHSFDDIYKRYKYDHPNQSIEPYLRLLKSRYLVNKVESDLFKNFIDIDGHKYAGSDDYESMLKSIYDSISENTSIDRLQRQFIHYKIASGR